MASGMDFLNKVAKTPAVSKSKQGSPVIELPNTKEIREAIATWIEQKRIEVTAESTRKMQEEVLRPIAEEAREAYCLEKGYSASVRVKCDESILQFSAPCKYSKIATNNVEKLKEIFSEELYNKYFRQVTNVALTDLAMKEIEKGSNILQKIVEAVGGPEAFQKYFSVEQYIEPMESFHMERVQDKAISKKAKKAIEDKLLKPTTPSFRES